MPQLVNAVADQQHPEDVTRSITSLVSKGYVLRDSDALTLTPEGHRVRTAVEAETNRIYFAPWGEGTDDAQLATWLAGVVAALCQ